MLATVVVGVSASLLTAYAGTGEPPAMIPTHSQEWYQHHILAVDEDGNGLLPAVSVSGPPDDPRYKANHRQKICDEDTRNAFLKNGQISPGLTVALQGRAPLMEYVSAMFQAIGERRPSEVIVYIHGGLNNIDGAIVKSAMLADRLDVEDKFFIGICWNSNLMPTYDQHLLAVREGLHQKEKAIVTAPAMLLADIGGSVVRLPLNLIDFLYQDAYVLNPKAFTRTKLAQARYNQIKRVYEAGLKTNLQRLDVSKEKDKRSEFQIWFRDFGRWLITEPVRRRRRFSWILSASSHGRIWFGERERCLSGNRNSFPILNMTTLVLWQRRRNRRSRPQNLSISSIILVARERSGISQASSKQT